MKLFIFTSLILSISSAFVSLFIWLAPWPEMPQIMRPPANAGTFSAFDLQNYHRDAKNLIDKFYAMLENGSLDMETVQDLRLELLGLTVGAEDRDVHVRAVVAFDSAVTYFKNGDKNKRAEALKAVDFMRQKNDWLK